MQGSLRQRRAGVFELRVYVGRDPISGKVRHRYETFHGGKRDAQRRLAELVAESDGMRAPVTAGTVGYLLQEWFDGAVHEWSPLTAQRYQQIIRDYLGPIHGVQLRKLSAKDLDDLYRALRRRGLSDRSVVQAHAVIRRALGVAQRWGWVQANVAALPGTRPQVRVAEVDPPTIPQMHAILAEAPTPEVALCWRVKAELGARRGEMCGLEWRDVDWDAGVIAIRQAVIRDPDGGDLLVKDTKTHATRRVSLDVGVMNLLAGHRLAMEQRATDEGTELDAMAFVWSHEPDGRRPWRPDYLTLAWSRARAKAGHPHVRQHDLRHLNATLQMAAGVPLKTIQKRLGHSTSAMLHQTYGHALPADDGAAAELLGRLLGDQSLGTA